MISNARDSVERSKHILSSPIKGCRKNFPSYVNELGFRFGTPGCRLESVTKFCRKCIKDGHRKSMPLHLEYFDALHWRNPQGIRPFFCSSSLVAKVSRRRALSHCACSRCAGAFELVGPGNRIYLQVILTWFRRAASSFLHWQIPNVTDSKQKAKGKSEPLLQNELEGTRSLLRAFMLGGNRAPGRWELLVAPSRRYLFFIKPFRYGFIKVPGFYLSHS